MFTRSFRLTHNMIILAACICLQAVASAWMHAHAVLLSFLAHAAVGGMFKWFLGINGCHT